MQVTFFSFFISLVWSSILVAIIYFCRKKHFFIRQFGMASLLLLYLFCVVRMAIPLEFTFTRGLSFKGIFSDFYQRIQIDKIGTSEISITAILLNVWIVVSVALLIRFTFQYYKAMREVSSYDKWEDEQCRKVYKRILYNSKRQLKINVRRNGDVNIPMGIGIVKKSIVLPDQNYSDQELYYILSHEYIHFLNRDLFVKMLIHIFCCVFWWNPIVYLLKKDLNQTLEIKCDLCITEQMDNEEKADYLTTIVSIIKKANIKRTKIFYGTTALVDKGYESELVERFKIVSENHKFRNKNKILTIAWFLAFLIMVTVSYSFVVQPYYEAPIEEIETEPGTKEIRGDNSYIVKNKDGTYTLVLPSGEHQIVDEDFAFIMKEQGFKIIEEEK